MSVLYKQIQLAHLTTRMMVTGIRWTGPFRLNAKPTWECKSCGLPTYDPS